MEDLTANDGPFDLLLTDTSLFQSMTAAIQCLKGKKVLQIDSNDYYGGPEAGSHKIQFISTSSKPTETEKETYSTFTYDPSPIVFYARGPLAQLLLNLELTEYIEFMAISQQYIWPSAQVLIPLPLSKEQVMLEPALTLSEKRKFSKLLSLGLKSLSSGSKFNSDSSLADLFKLDQIQPESRVFQLIAYSACRCSSLQEVSTLSLKSAKTILETLQSSIAHLNLQSPFVVPLWGSSEISQAASRKSALQGCIQMFGKSFSKDILGTSLESTKSIVLSCPPPVPIKLFRATALLDMPVLKINNTVLLTIPPRCDLNFHGDAAINILQLTSDSKCCPIGTWLVYLWSTEFQDFNSLIQNFLIEKEETKIFWSNFQETSSIPHYENFKKRESDENGNLPVAAPFQPIQPASFDDERKFTEALNLLNDIIDLE